MWLEVSTVKMSPTNNLKLPFKHTVSLTFLTRAAMFSLLAMCQSDFFAALVYCSICSHPQNGIYCRRNSTIIQIFQDNVTPSRRWNTLENQFSKRHIRK